jgi:hypothetical protein
MLHWRNTVHWCSHSEHLAVNVHYNKLDALIVTVPVLASLSTTQLLRVPMGKDVLLR